ncbi:MAG: hypothetical protein U0797_15215 [Gemmataceae bacterium]
MPQWLCDVISSSAKKPEDRFALRPAEVAALLASGPPPVETTQSRKAPEGGPARVAVPNRRMELPPRPCRW